MYIPKHFQRVITSNTASWKALGVRIEESRTIREKGVPTIVIQVRTLSIT